MLEKFEEKNDINRQKVIEYLKTSKFDLQRFTIEEFDGFPGGLELIDKKGREIVLFYNYLIDEVEIAYKNLKKDALGVYLSVVMFLLEDYKEITEGEETIRAEAVDENRIRFIKRSNKARWKGQEIAISPIFDINNELYDMYDYLETQIQDFKEMRGI